MPVGKTESRIPFDFQPSDFGQAVLSSGEQCALVSYVTSPLVVERENSYVVFVTDASLASSVEQFEWSFAENDGPPSTQTTEFGETAYTPQSIGSLSLTLRLLDPGDTELATVSFDQEIVALHAEIEALINDANDSVEPGIGNPDVARELVNDHSPYYQDIALRTSESGDAFQRFVFTMTYEGALRRTPRQRKDHSSQMAASLNRSDTGFQSKASDGVGVCGVRLALLAMTVPESSGSESPLIQWTELPEPSNQRLVAYEQLLESLAALDEGQRIDLYNLVRFPKSNITHCASIIEKLRDRYFPGANFSDVLTGMSGTRAHWIVRHFREGPLSR